MSETAEKNKWPCPGRPEDLKDQPIGMYHCEFCGEMQIAGTSHLPPQFPSQWEEPFPKIEEPPMADVDHGVGCRLLNTGCDGDCDCGALP